MTGEKNLIPEKNVEINYQPIGVVRTPFKNLDEIPRQSISGGAGVEGRIELKPEYEAGLFRLKEYEHLILLCHFHESKPFHLEVTPPGATKTRGLFASRSPNRPNPIGLSVVKLVDIKGPVLHIQDLDILDNTPLLDMKPFFPSLEPKPGP